jgi:hypothetical protein
MSTLFLFLAFANVPAEPSGRMEPIYNLAALSLAELVRMDGRAGLYRVNCVGSLPEEYRGHNLVDFKLNNPHPLGTVWLLPGEVADDDMVVQARLRVVHHPAWTDPDGRWFPAVIELRLMDARRVRYGDFPC